MEHCTMYGPRTSTPKCMFSTSRVNYDRQQIQTPRFIDENDEYETIDEHRGAMINEDYMFDCIPAASSDYSYSSDDTEYNTETICPTKNHCTQLKSNVMCNRMELYKMKTHQMQSLFSRMKSKLHSMQSRAKRNNKKTTQQDLMTQSHKCTRLNPVTHVSGGVKHTAL